MCCVWDRQKALLRIYINPRLCKSVLLPVWMSLCDSSLGECGFWILGYRIWQCILSSMPTWYWCLGHSWMIEKSGLPKKRPAVWVIGIYKRINYYSSLSAWLDHSASRQPNPILIWFPSTSCLKPSISCAVCFRYSIKRRITGSECCRRLLRLCVCGSSKWGRWRPFITRWTSATSMSLRNVWLRRSGALCQI